MHFTPNSRQVTVLLIIAAGISLPQATSWKGMLEAQPAQLTAHLADLTDFRDVSILVEGLPDALKDSLTKEDIEGWTANRLKNMGLRVVSHEVQTVAFLAADDSTDEKALAVNDRHRSQVYVNVNADRLATGAIYASVTLRCDRGVFVHPGYFGTAAVWDRGALIYFTSGYDAKTEIRDNLNELLDLLEKDWKTCNR